MGKTEATGTWAYAYDADNRLIRVVKNASTIATFTYDPFGRRVSKTTSAGTVYYVYDGEDILAEVDSAGNLVTYYVHGPGIDEPLAMVRGGQTAYYHADALGTVTHMTNTSGAVVQEYAYDSFGNLTGQSGTVSQPYTYTARNGTRRRGCITTAPATTIPRWGGSLPPIL
jgi:YD repeat-containing protein